jgi:D-tyrosyl-tRNA(Tyr) deacylase
VISILQRVREARVEVAGRVTGRIGPGLLALVCAEQGDSEAQADKLLAKVLKLRIFSDEAGKMNRSVQDVGGGLLIVSQFTLAADTRGGNRPSFTHPMVQTGEFAADMQVHLVNDGPVTIPLRMEPASI